MQLHNLDNWIIAFQVELYGIWAIVCILAFALTTSSYWEDEGYVALIYSMCVISLLGMIYLWYTGEWAWYAHHTQGSSWYHHLAISTTRYQSSYLTTFVRGWVLVLSLCCMCLHRVYFNTRKQDKVWEYPVLVILITLIMYLFINVQELMLAVLALEAMTLSLYVMASLNRNSNLSMEGALRFFFTGGLGSGMMLMGTSILYAITGTTQLLPMNAALHVNHAGAMGYVAAVLILATILFKFALAPLHVWIGDVFQGVHGYFASYMAMVTKLPVLVLFIKIHVYVFMPLPYMNQAITMVAVISLCISALYALRELNFKRFWGITSISHMSYVTLAVCATDHVGLGWAVMYIIIYLICALGIWTIILRVHKNPGHDINVSEFFIWLPRLSALNLTNPAFTLGLVYLFLSAAGIPPALGFAPKFLILNHMYNQGHFYLVAIVYASQVISTVYYLRVIRFAFFKTPSDPHSMEAYTLPSGVEQMLLVTTIMVNILFGYYFLDIIVWLQQLSWSFMHNAYVGG